MESVEHGLPFSIKREKENMMDEKSKLIDEVTEQAIQNDMIYFG